MKVEFDSLKHEGMRKWQENGFLFNAATKAFISKGIRFEKFAYNRKHQYFYKKNDQPLLLAEPILSIRHEDEFQKFTHYGESQKNPIIVSDEGANKLWIWFSNFVRMKTRFSVIPLNLLYHAVKFHLYISFKRAFSQAFRMVNVWWTSKHFHFH